MRKYILIFCVLGFVGILLAVTFLLKPSGAELISNQKNSDEISEATEDDLESVEQLEEFNGTGDLFSLKLLHKNLECRITHINTETSSSVDGTFFIVGEKTRGDFVVISEDLGGETVSSMINDTEYLYTWSVIEGEEYGVKLKISDIENSNIDMREPISEDSNIKYSCKEWKSTDESIFVPPASVLFQDMSELMKAGMEYGTVYEEGEF